MDITSQMDALYWGILISTMLMGVTMCQGWTYANNNNDKWHLRLLVAVLLLMDFAVTCLSCYLLRHYLMSSFGNTGPLSVFPLEGLVITIISGIVAYLSELFFASRIYLLDKSSWWAAAIAGLSSMVSFVFFMLPCRTLWKDPYIRTLTNSQTRLWAGISLSFTVVAATTVTVILTMKLSRTHTSIKRTQKILHQLHLFIVTRGLLVMLNAIGYLIVYEIQPHGLNWAPFLHFVSKLHVISIVAMLNARSPLAKLFDTGITISVETQNYQNSEQVSNSFMRNPVANGSKSHSMHFACVPDEANNLVTY